MLLWLLVVAAFASFGLLRAAYDGHLSFELLALDSALFYGGIGVTVATCVAASLHAARRLQAKSVTFDEAIQFVFLCSAIAAFTPPFAMALSGHWSEGEDSIGILYLGAYTVGIGLLGFVAFLILCPRRDA
jgi:TRAP-type C4-dicarboxylate transport system permease large subunit